MAQQQRSGKPYSGANPIPNIQKFVESLDKDKRERDRQIDEQNKLNEQQHGEKKRGVELGDRWHTRMNQEVLPEVLILYTKYMPQHQHCSHATSL